MSDSLDDLVALTRTLGDPAQDYVILGEGNTSVRVDAESFWVKGSGAIMQRAERDSFVHVQFGPILDSLDGPALDDAKVKQLLQRATIAGGRSPSIETFLHALCLRLDGVRFVGHTHPAVGVGLLSSQHSRELFAGSLFPDQIVILGPAYAYVPYTDPGLPLALAVRQSLQDFVSRHQRVPRAVLMENHGFIALGGTPQEVLNVTQMFVKTCRVLVAALAGGGPRFLTPENVERIDRRPDELARRRDLR